VTSIDDQLVPRQKVQAMAVRLGTLGLSGIWEVLWIGPGLSMQQRPESPTYLRGHDTIGDDWEKEKNKIGDTRYSGYSQCKFMSFILRFNLLKLSESVKHSPGSILNVRLSHKVELSIQCGQTIQAVSCPAGCSPKGDLAWPEALLIVGKLKSWLALSHLGYFRLTVYIILRSLISRQACEL